MTTSHTLDPALGDSFYKEGVALFEDGSREALLLAAKKFKTATTLQPAYFDAWLSWGETLLCLGQMSGEHHYFIEAEKKLKKAMPLCPSRSQEIELYWSYAIVWTKIASGSGEAADLQKALIAFDHIQKESLPQEFWHDYGTASLNMAGKINDPRFLTQAIDCFRRSVSLALSFFESWLCLARSLIQLYTRTHQEELLTQIHESFSAAAHLEPSSTQLWHEWATFLLELGRNAKNIKQLQSALEKCQKDHPLLLAIEAEILATMGELTDRIDLIAAAGDKIAQVIDHSLDVEHSHGKCLLSFGGYFHDLDYYYQAIEKFQENLSEDRTRHQDWWGMGKAYAAIGELDSDADATAQAIRFYTKALHLKPLPHYYFECACALSFLGDFTQDPQLLKQAIAYFEYTHNPHPHWVFQYAVALNQLGELEDNEALHHQALSLFSQLEPDFPKLHFHQGLAYASLASALDETHYFHKAIDHFSLDLEQTHDSEATLLEWGTTLIHMGQLTSDEGAYLAAEEKLLQAARLGNEEAFYQLGCLYSLMGKSDHSLHFLQKSHAAKTLPPLEELLDDQWLETVRLTSAFQEFISHLDS